MKDLVENISKILSREKVKFIVIGALARDLYFETKNIKIDIGTLDIDFAILVDTWEEFESIKNLLKREMGLQVSPQKAYRLLHGKIPIDLLPFGKIAEPGFTVKWPGTFRERIKVLGFQEAYNNATTLPLGSVYVKILIPEMFVALKLSSWSHGKDRGKDAMDIRLVLENLKFLCPDLANEFSNQENEYFYERYQDDEVGLMCSVFARRIQNLLNTSGLAFYLSNLLSSAATIDALMVDMNEGQVLTTEERTKLEKIVIPFQVGITAIF